ncbi:MAG: peptide chain release factor N(5)-glutamine methyltransferase [Akkermansiaceae bacterium]|nr:peptide chain release factor N(5)-glutamine methyltransferase [Akkermansiaceae bacterium]
MKTIQDILTSGTAYLEARGIEGARHSMQSLMVHVLGCNRTWLYLHYEDPLSEEKLVPLRELLKRRGKGEPLQHLLGSTEFYRREFRTDSRALIPRPETEELVEFALQMAPRRQGMRVLDMGCGSGIIGITLALELAKQQPEIVMADISEAALSLTLENAAALEAKVKTYRSDLFTAWDTPAEGAVQPPDLFNLVLANLPYVPEGEAVSAEVQHDPATALYGGADGLDIVRRFVKDALPHLADRALVMLEVGHDQGEATRALMEELGYTQTRVLTDMSGKPRFPMGFAPARPEPTDKDDHA